MKKKFFSAVAILLVVFVGFVCACAPSGKDNTEDSGGANQKQESNSGDSETKDDDAIELPDIDL